MDRCFAIVQYVLPKQLLSRFIYYLMRRQSPWLKRLLISGFLRSYAVNMQEAIAPDPLSYPSFNAFFTRALRTGARPLPPEEDAVVSPVDGTVSQSGRLEGDSILQAKGREYSALDLLGGDPLRARSFQGGHFVCLYLAPFNYHRIHMPVTGKVSRTLYIPGSLFSVNAATARAVPRLFARNERVVCEFTTAVGPLALVMVGALFVGSMETVWTGEINPPPRPRRGVLSLPQGTGTEIARGDEVGRFNMGSTVILLFGPDAVQWSAALTPGTPMRMGQRIGTRVARS